MPHKRSPLLALLCLTSALLLSPDVTSHPAESWGLTSNAAAQGNAMAAICTPVEAVFYNIARAIPGPDAEVAFGFTYANDALKINDNDAEIAPHYLVMAGLSARLPLSDWLADRLGLSLAVVLPGDAIYTVEQPDDETPTLPFWDGRNRRLVLSGGVALRPLEWLSFGVGATLLPDVTGKVSVDLADESGRNATEIVVDYNLAPSLGVYIAPMENVDLALTWKGAHTTELEMPVDVEVAKGVAPVRALVTSPAYSQADQITAGVAIRPFMGLRTSLETTWFNYSAFRYSSPDVKVLGDSDDDILQESLKEDIDFSDAWTVRVGIEWRLLETLALRTGYRFVETPVPPQTGIANLLDADAHTASLGLGASLPEGWRPNAFSLLEIDLHGALSVLDRREFEKTVLAPENPGYPRISVDGAAYSFGLGLRVALR